ncbi:MAG: cysteine peptidase family C39 domain-containing protein [bacterium]|nr:cysteine peptidase family C39 domain-containing protein [bacterium]MDT8396531.1 cysteine peptidase family C39 domain-containing protein [bacterium]
MEPDRFPEAVRLHDVTPYIQEPLQCGPYALAAVQDFMGIETDAGEMSRRLYSPGAGGTLTMDLFLEATRSGLPARQLSGSASNLQDQLESGPVIVLFRYPALVGSGGHFIVVTGYSSSRKGFFILWGDGRLTWMDEKRFDGMWSGSGRWMLTFDRVAK